MESKKNNNAVVVEDENDQVDNKRTSRLLTKISSIDENKTCADCSALGTLFSIRIVISDPQFASVSLGIVICETCAEIHQSLGVQSKLRDLRKNEKWEVGTLEVAKN